MGLLSNITDMMLQSRQCIIETMRERNLTNVKLVMTKSEYMEANELDEDCDQLYSEYKYGEAPRIIHFDKWDEGVWFIVESVDFVDDTNTLFKLNCYNPDDGNCTFSDTDVTFLYMSAVYDAMEEALGIEKEADKVWVVTQESNVNGEIMFNVVVCKDLGTAIREVKKKIDTILDESPKYKDARKWMEGNEDTLNYDDCPFYWENENHDAWYLKTLCDDYYELIKIEEKEINLN